MENVGKPAASVDRGKYFSHNALYLWRSEARRMAQVNGSLGVVDSKNGKMEERDGKQ